MNGIECREDATRQWDWPHNSRLYNLSGSSDVEFIQDDEEGGR